MKQTNQAIASPRYLQSGIDKVDSCLLQLKLQYMVYEFNHGLPGRAPPIALGLELEEWMSTHNHGAFLTCPPVA